MRRPGKSAASHDGAPQRHRDGGRSREIMAELSPPRSRTENISPFAREPRYQRQTVIFAIIHARSSHERDVDLPSDTV